MLTDLTAQIAAAYEDITHRTDGPLTGFVLMSRACDLVAKGRNPEAVANALHEALHDLFGFDSAGTDVVPSLERC